MDKRILKKKTILELIRSEKDVLFGKFSKNLTHDIKKQTWNRITAEAKASGSIPHGKSENYIRDDFWPNCRRKTMEKIDHAKQTGGPGEETMHFDEVDNMVLDIIGK